MKINGDFAVIVNGKRFGAHEIREIHIDGGLFKMLCDFGSETEITVECRTRDVEFVNTPQVPELPKFGCAYCRCGFVPYLHNESMEPKAPLDVVKKAFREAIKELGENKQCDVTLKIDGKDLASIFKKYNHTGGD